MPSRMIRALRRAHACRWGVPVVDRVDTAVFVRRYFVHCMQCGYCQDSCCQHGSDIDRENVTRVERHAFELEQYTGIPQQRWWTRQWTDDVELPGGAYTRTAVENGACVFQNRKGRGCMLHSFALERGIDYHELKPMVASLFPITFDSGLLHPSTEIVDRSLRCIDDGPSLYEGVRGEIRWYFGDRLVSELDDLQSEVLASQSI